MNFTQRVVFFIAFTLFTTFPLTLQVPSALGRTVNPKGNIGKNAYAKLLGGKQEDISFEAVFSLITIFRSLPLSVLSLLILITIVSSARSGKEYNVV